MSVRELPLLTEGSIELLGLIPRSSNEVAELLDDEEVAALQRRVQRMLVAGVLPIDRAGMCYPRPLD